MTPEKRKSLDATAKADQKMVDEINAQTAKDNAAHVRRTPIAPQPPKGGKVKVVP